MKNKCPNTHITTTSCRTYHAKKMATNGSCTDWDKQTKRSSYHQCVFNIFWRTDRFRNFEFCRGPDARPSAMAQWMTGPGIAKIKVHNPIQKKLIWPYAAGGRPAPSTNKRPNERKPSLCWFILLCVWTCWSLLLACCTGKRSNGPREDAGAWRHRERWPQLEPWLITLSASLGSRLNKANSTHHLPVKSHGASEGGPNAHASRPRLDQPCSEAWL